MNTFNYDMFSPYEFNSLTYGLVMNAFSYDMFPPYEFNSFPSLMGKATLSIDSPF